VGGRFDVDSLAAGAGGRGFCVQTFVSSISPQDLSWDVGFCVETCESGFYAQNSRIERADSTSIRRQRVRAGGRRFCVQTFVSDGSNRHRFDGRTLRRNRRGTAVESVGRASARRIGCS
jgi:hypothetical protein